MNLLVTLIIVMVVLSNITALRIVILSVKSSFTFDIDWIEDLFKFITVNPPVKEKRDKIKRYAFKRTSFNKGYKFINKVKCDKNIFVNKLAKNTKLKFAKSLKRNKTYNRYRALKMYYITKLFPILKQNGKVFFSIENNNSISFYMWHDVKECCSSMSLDAKCSKITGWKYNSRYNYFNDYICFSYKHSYYNLINYLDFSSTSMNKTKILNEKQFYEEILKLFAE